MEPFWTLVLEAAVMGGLLVVLATAGRGGRVPQASSFTARKPKTKYKLQGCPFWDISRRDLV